MESSDNNILRLIGADFFNHSQAMIVNLNDKGIREALIQKLRNQHSKPKAIIEELRVHNGGAIADVVALYSEAHCYEIKGCNDKIERILAQGSYYNTAFRRITVVTTVDNLEKALLISPPYWGVMVARILKNRVSIAYARPARVNPDFRKELAVLTLWKSEMLHLLDDQKYQRKPREILAQLISETQKKADLSSRICNILFDRYVS